MKIIYFADIAGDIDGEIILLKDEFESYSIHYSTFEFRKTPQFLYDEEYFDVLLFDWGGMSFGNSLLETFCADIIKHAREHPSRIYIMTSYFTEYAMEEML